MARLRAALEGSGGALEWLQLRHERPLTPATSDLWQCALIVTEVGSGAEQVASRASGILLARTLQGKYLLTDLAAAEQGERTWRPLVLPRGRRGPGVWYCSVHPGHDGCDVCRLRSGSLQAHR